MNGKSVNLYGHYLSISSCKADLLNADLESVEFVAYEVPTISDVASYNVIAHAAELLGMPVPPEVPFDRAEMTPMARSFYADSKRVRNDRIKDELGIGLLYPDYRSGLRALLRDEAG